MADVTNLLGRILLAVLFFAGAIQKLVDPAPVQMMITSIGLPAALVWLIAPFNLVAAICLVTGPKIGRWALILAAYCIFTSWFHWQLRADPWQVSIMIKNWAIAGGLLILAAQGPGRYSIFR